MGNGLAARHGGRLGLAALIAVLLLGLGLRMIEAWDGRAPVFDAAAYAAIAANLEQGEGFTVGAAATQPSSNYSPGLPLFVAGLYEVGGGEHERFARVVLAIIGSLSVLFAYLIGRRLGRAGHRRSQHRPVPGELDPATAAAKTQRTLKRSPHEGGNSADAEFWSALVGAFVVAVYPALLEYQGMLMGEPLAAALLSGAVLAVMWAGDEGASWYRWLLAGALLGALALVRPEYLAISVLLALAVAIRPSSLFVARSQTRDDLAGGGWRRSFLAAGVMLAGVALVIAPWTIRNAVALDRFVPISTGGGQVLFAGTYLPSDGDPEKVGREVVARNPDLFQAQDAQRLRLEQVLARLAADRHPGIETDRALSQMGKDQLWENVREEPAEYSGFIATKVWRTWSHGPRDVMREPVWEALHWALVAFGLFGLGLLAWLRRWEALLIGTIFLAITAVSALLVASPRRVLVLVPLLAALASPGIAWLADKTQRALKMRRYRGQDSALAPDRRDSLGAS